MKVLGIMSGTSIDGVDYALCEAEPGRVRLIEHRQRRFPSRLRTRLEAVAEGASSSWETARVHHDLGRFYAKAARDVIGQQTLEAIGLHGQTVFHEPAKQRPATFQLGEPAWLTEEFRVPVVSNFRAGDLAAGGQGAPLATLFHQTVFGRRGRSLCVNNLGGISNVTSIDWRSGTAPTLLAFDTGPANLLLDLAARDLSEGRNACDRNGRLAAAGMANDRLLRDWLRDPYFRRSPPKSTGRERFGKPYWQRIGHACAELGLNHEDILATLTEFTARSMALNYRLHLPHSPDCVILAGGGAHNGTLVKRIRACLTIETVTCDSLGWPAQAIEPAAFALLAACRIRKVPGNIPETTGARRPALLGQICLP